MTCNLEIERKWLVTRIPNGIKYYEQLLVEQFYLSYTPEIRIKRVHKLFNKENECFCRLDIKSSGNLIRNEISTFISEEFYEDAIYIRRSKNIDLLPLYKTFFVFEKDEHNIEFNYVYFDNRFLFCYAEVEFKSDKEAKEYEFPYPNLVIQEVTEDPTYKMANVFKA